MQNEATKNTNVILNDLTEYVFKKMADIDDTEETRHNITKAFRKYILDESSNGPFDAYISAFIMEISTNKEYTEKINQIREGHILYDGLCQNEAISTQSWKDTLTIYLDTEILFHISGYNGLTFQKIAQEFLSLVDAANKDKTIIKLKFFNETKKEIDKFFSTAETLLENKSVIRPGETAMSSILQDCKSSIDITNKKNSFYYNLNKIHIYEETKSDFYTDKYKKYNLESTEYVNTQNEKNVIQLSNINKLRGNNITADYSKCSSLLISENSSVLDLSRVFTLEKNEQYTKESGQLNDITQLAVNLYTATNYLWYKLNRSLANTNTPSTIDSVIRAQIVLSKYINESITFEYDNIMEQFQNGKIEKDEIATLILGMRQRSSKPETIVKEGVDDALNLICEKDINKYKENFELERQAHKELENEYNNTLAQLAATQENLDILKSQMILQQEQNSLLREKEKLNTLNEWLELYSQQFDSEKHNAQKSKKIRTVLAIICYSIYYVAIIFLIYKFSWDIMEKYTYILGIPPILYLFVLNALDIKFSLKMLLTSYERKSSYIEAQRKYNQYLEKVSTQEIIVDELNKKNS